MTDDSLRASDADREATVARLQHAFAEGRLELAEVDERTAAAYAAKTFGDLAALTRDLPAEPPAPARTPQTPRQPSAPPSWAEQHGQDVWRWTQYGLPPVIVISVIVWVAIGLTSHWTHPWWIWIIVAWVCGGVGGRRGRQRRRRDWHDRRDGPGRYGHGDRRDD